jgi:hypothetical protein
MSFMFSFSAISITYSEHTNNKTHNVLPSIFALKYYTQYSYMFQSTRVHHHRINTNNTAQKYVGGLISLPPL